MEDKPLLWLHEDRIEAPPFSEQAQDEAGYYLWMVQHGELLSMPHSRPMPSIGPACHELRIKDADHEWRIFYAIADEAILLLGIHDKKTRETPKSVIDLCKTRFTRYQSEQKRDK
jgi:phage-related protein